MGPLPTDPDPKFNGTSVGHWEGDTLVAETVGFSPLTEIERNVPRSDKMRNFMDASGKARVTLGPRK